MTYDFNTIGTRIAKARKDAGLTQAKLAEELGVTFQAISLWERDETLPDTDNLIQLAEVLQVSVSSLVEDRGDFHFTTHKRLFEWQHMEAFVRHTSRACGMRQTLKALDYAKKAHEGQTRKKSDIPYIYHPLNMACHLFALGIRDDVVMAACLLHDVVEDCGVTCDELPFDDQVKQLVRLLTHAKSDDAGERKNILDAYYKAIAADSRAALIKCVDRCNNLTTMSWGLSREKIYRYIQDSDTYILPLLKVIKDDPSYNDAAWLLKYQIESMLDIYKRLL